MGKGMKQGDLLVLSIEDGTGKCLGELVGLVQRAVPRRKSKTPKPDYEKPFELMTESEQKLYQDFLSHQKAANDYVKKIERLQYQLEEASFERDSILQDAMQAGFMGPSVTNALDKKKKRVTIKTDEETDFLHLNRDEAPGS